jgi:hypothetical protein
MTLEDFCKSLGRPGKKPVHIRSVRLRCDLLGFCRQRCPCVMLKPAETVLVCLYAGAPLFVKVFPRKTLKAAGQLLSCVRPENPSP